MRETRPSGNEPGNRFGLAACASWPIASAIVSGVSLKDGTTLRRLNAATWPVFLPPTLESAHTNGYPWGPTGTPPKESGIQIREGRSARRMLETERLKIGNGSSRSSLAEGVEGLRSILPVALAQLSLPADPNCKKCGEKREKKKRLQKRDPLLTGYNHGNRNRFETVSLPPNFLPAAMLHGPKRPTPITAGYVTGCWYGGMVLRRYIRLRRHARTEHTPSKSSLAAIPTCMYAKREGKLGRKGNERKKKATDMPQLVINPASKKHTAGGGFFFSFHSRVCVFLIRCLGCYFPLSSTLSPSPSLWH